MPVSVIVPTRNSERTIRACLASVRAQRNATVELIVVDNHSADRTAEIAREYADTVLIVGPERSAQRNLGASRAKGEILVFIDSDMVLEGGVVGECVSAFEETATPALVIPEESFGKGFWAACKRFERSFYVGVPWMEAPRAFRRAAFMEAGGFDESLVAGEDWDLGARVARTGALGRIGSRILHDEGAPTLASLVRKKLRYARAFRGYRAKPEHRAALRMQTGIVARYGLYFRSPRRLWKNPALAIGMLFMKSCEFGIGAIGYGLALLRRSRT